MRHVPRPARRRKTRRPFFEALEDRTVLSGGLLAAPLDLLPATPVQAPATPTTSAPAASSSLLGILDAPVAQNAPGATAPRGLNLNLDVHLDLPGVAQVNIATDLAVGGKQGLAVQTTLNAGVTVLGTNVLNTHTGVAVGLGGSSGITLNLGTATTLAGTSLLALNANVGAALGGGKGVDVTTGTGLQAGGQGGLTVGTGGTIVLNNGGGSAGGGGGVVLGNPGGGSGGSGGAGGGGIFTPGGSGGIIQPGGGAFGQGPPAVANTGGAFVVPAGPAGAAGGGSTAAPLTAATSTAAGGLALLSGAPEEATGAEFLPATPAAVQEATTGQVLDAAVADVLFQDQLLFGAGNDTDLSNVVAPEVPAAVAEPGVATAEPVVSDPELFDGAQPLLPQGDDLVQGCVPFDVKSLDDSLHNLVQQFQLLSWDFAGLMARLGGSSWFVAMAVLAVTCEVCRRKAQKARRRLSLADGNLTWFPTLTGSGSSEER